MQRSGRPSVLPSVLVSVVVGAAIAAATLATVTAASTSFWLVSTQADFLKGEAEQLTVDTDGRVMLGPAVDTLHQTSTPAVWRLAIDSEGAVWAGTGNEGKVIKVDAGGKASVAFDATELEIHAIAPAATAAGGVFAGSSPDGKVYKLAKDGSSTTYFDPDDKYIWTLLTAPDGTLYAGTGEKGRIHKITAEGKGTVLYESGTTHVTALAWDGKGALLVGTSSPGRVVRVDPTTGRGFVLLESSYKEIRAIRVSSAGSVYVTAVGAASAESTSAPTEKPSTDTTTTSPIPTVSTEVTITAIGDQTIVTPSTSGSRSESRGSGSGKGAVYRIEPDGDWDELWSSNEDAPYDVLIEPNGSLLVATGDKGKIFRISGDPTVSTLVTRAVSQQVTSFAQDAQGRLHYATSNPGRILRMAKGQAERGTYLSDVKDTTTVSTWGSIRWRAVMPAGSGVELFTRTGNTKTPDSTWSDWSKPYTQAAGEAITSPKARYLQWRAVLTGGKSSPILTSVTTAYLPRNARPTMEAITVHPPGVVFQRPFPTGDPELAGFEAATSDGRQSAQSSSSSLSIGSMSSGPPLGRRTYQKSLQTFVWRADDTDEDKLQFDVFYRREGETEWKLLKRQLWDGIYTWDTTSVPDGTYVIKIVASDAPSNSPSAALSAERESTTFEIDNTPPTIDTTASAIQRAQAQARNQGQGGQGAGSGGSASGSGSGSATGSAQTTTASKAVFVVRDSHSPIQRVEYSTSAGGWRLLYPIDGLLDAREERFEIAREPTSTEPIVLRATDTLGNVATAVLPAPAAKPTPNAAR